MNLTRFNNTVTIATWSLGYTLVNTLLPYKIYKNVFIVLTVSSVRLVRSFDCQQAHDLGHMDWYLLVMGVDPKNLFLQFTC